MYYVKKNKFELLNTCVVPKHVLNTINVTYECWFVTKYFRKLQ